MKKLRAFFIWFGIFYLPITWTKDKLITLRELRAGTILTKVWTSPQVYIYPFIHESLQCLVLKYSWIGCFKITSPLYVSKSCFVSSLSEAAPGAGTAVTWELIVLGQHWMYVGKASNILCCCNVNSLLFFHFSLRALELIYLAWSVSLTWEQERLCCSYSNEE